LDKWETPSFYEILDGIRPCRFFEPVIVNPPSEIDVSENITVFQSVQMCTYYNIVTPTLAAISMVVSVCDSISSFRILRRTLEHNVSSSVDCVDVEAVIFAMPLLQDESMIRHEVRGEF
jgi:hypothetical protein